MLEAAQPTPAPSGLHHHGESISDERLESLYRSLRQPIQAYLERRLHDPEMAEDLLHDVFVKIHERAAKLERGDRIESWIWAIVRNALVDRQRRRKSSEPIEDVAADEPNDVREIGPLHRTVRAFLDCIGEPYREALVLADLEGVPQTELAQRLGLSHSGAKSRVQRARNKMAALIQQCCHLEFDRFGNVIDYRPKGPKCPGCGPETQTANGESSGESCCDDSSSCSSDPHR